MKYIKLFFFTSILVLAAGCKKFIDVNNDPNRPIDVQERLMLPPLLLHISYNLTGGTSAIYINHFMQNIALNQPVPNIGTFLMVPQDADVIWNNGYATILNNLKIMIGKAETSGLSRYAGIGKVSLAFTLGNLTDMFGDLPYSEAFKGSANFTPGMDSQQAIYNEIERLLNDGITDLNKNSPISPGAADIIYQGDVSKWKKLASTLKARYAMHLTNAPGQTAAAQADKTLAALNDGFSSNADDFQYKYPGGANTENPWALHFRPISTIVLSSAAVDTLVVRNDPRLPFIVRRATATNLYNGRPIGTTTIGALADYSIPAAAYAGEGAVHAMVTYAEALFLKAEATLLKSGAAAAEPIYQDAIRAHMTKLGVGAAEQNDYLSRRGSLTAAGVTPLERIMQEKKVANFLNIENWVDWRRTGFPRLTPPPNALSAIPRRLLYPQSERNSNPQTVHSAGLTDRVWWDKP